MGRPSKYPVEFRERAVRMVAEVRPQYGSQWAAICAVAGKLGIGAPETVRTWVPPEVLGNLLDRHSRLPLRATRTTSSHEGRAWAQRHPPFPQRPGRALAPG
jgi:transposase-like protein